MKLTYIFHSGYLLENERSMLIIDYWKDSENKVIERALSKLRRGLEDLSEIIEAKVGDKTIVDTLAPAVEAVEQSDRDRKSVV